MKRLAFVITLVLACIMPSLAQSSWYNPYAGSSAPQSIGGWGSNKGWRYENYETSFSNGTKFQGQVEKNGDQIISYKGIMKYPNGDMQIGSWTSQWVPTHYHDYYRESDHTKWKRTFDAYGNLVNEVQQIATSQAASGGNTYQSTSGGNSNSGSGSSSYQKHYTKCAGCNGTGRCQHCGGSGYLDNYRRKCSLCHGTGRCQSCAGQGGFHR